MLDVMLLIDASDGDCKQNEEEPCPLGEANGELGMLDGCVISMLSRWLSNALLCGGDISTSLFTVAKDEKVFFYYFSKQFFSSSRRDTQRKAQFLITFLTVDPVRLRKRHVGRLRVPFHLSNF